MTHRERISATFAFRNVDHAAVDLMEGFLWPECAAHFRARGCKTWGDAYDHLDTDFRWVYGWEDNAAIPLNDPKPGEERVAILGASFTDAAERRLRSCETAADVERAFAPDLEKSAVGDFRSRYERYPDHPIVWLNWQPLLCGAWGEFGMEEALMRMHSEPVTIEAYMSIMHAYTMASLERTLRAQGQYIDYVHLGDDYASETSLILSPALWKKFIYARVREQVDLVHRYGKRVIFHSCGAVSALYPWFIDIGIDAHLVFQTTARGMEPERIAREFGGKMVFYGGIDVQRVLVTGTPEIVRQEVRRNVRAFEKCGGYIVANSHHNLPDIRADLMECMTLAARECTFDI